MSTASVHYPLFLLRNIFKLPTLVGEDRGVETLENRGERGARGGREKDERQNKYGEITQQCIIFRNRKKAKETESRKKGEEAGYARYRRREV